MTLQDLFDAFLAQVESDEWETMSDFETDIDLLSVAKAAKPWFKFPRCSLDWEEIDFSEGEENSVTPNKVNFVDQTITNTEIQILAAFMKMIWYGRVVDSWENLRPLYTERDFSPGKMLAEFKGRAADQKKNAQDLERVYYRSVNGKPFDYKQFAGG